MLSYKKEIVYLGLLFSDTGNINHDVRLNIQNKRSNVSVKYTNFCSRNYLAPVKVKLTVLHACVMSSLCYGCETWGNNSCKELEVVYRIGLKTALSVRPSTYNEIVYIEAGTYPAICTVRKQQIKFWLSILRNLEFSSSLSNLIQRNTTTLHCLL